MGDLVKWNFEKFLVDKSGKVVERYPPTTSPFQIEVWSFPLHPFQEMKDFAFWVVENVLDD